MGGVEVQLGGPRQRALLAYLVLLDGTAVDTSVLLADVWGSEHSDGADRSLATLLSRLRRLIEPLGWAIERRSGTCRLVASGRTSDVRRFIELVDQGALELTRGHHQAAVEPLEQAIGIWRGQPLAGLDAGYVDRERRRLIELLGVAEVGLVECLLRSGRPRDAVVRAERLVDDVELDEHRWALLVESYFRAGRPRDALNGFQRARRVLRDELGLDPGPELVALERLVIGATAESVVDADTDAPQASVEPSSVFVGRLDEIRTIRDAVGDPAPDRPVLIVVEGAGGSGKSRLIEEAVAGIADHVVRVECCPTARGSFGLLLRALGARVDVATLDVEGATGRDLRRLMDVDAPIDPDRFGLVVPRMLAAFDLLAEAAMSLGPVAVVVEDLQWADSMTLGALASWAAQPGARHGLRVVASVRRRHSDTVEDWLRDPRWAVTRIELGSLSPDESVALLELAGELPTWRIDEVVRIAGGHVLTLVEFGRLLAQMPDPAGAIPDELRGVLSVRLSSLDDTETAVLEVGSLLDEIDVSLIAEVLRTSVREVARSIDAAAGVGMLRRGEAGRYVFGHQLIAQHTRDTLGRALREAYHGELARALTARSHHVDAAQHALQADGALDRQDRFELLERGGRSATEVGELDTARTLLTEASVIAPSDDARRRVDVELGSVELALGDVDAGTARLAAVRTNALAVSDWATVIDALQRQSRSGLPVERVATDEMRAVLTEALAHLDPSDTQRRAYAVSARFHLDSPFGSRDSPDLAELDDLAQRDPDVTSIARVCAYRHEVDHGADPGSAAVEGQALRDACRRAGDRTSALIVELLRCSALLRAGATVDDDEFAAAQRDAEVLGWNDAAYSAAAITALHAIVSTPLQAAEHRVEVAAGLGLATGHPAATITGLFHMFAIRREQGRSAEYLGVMDGVVGRMEFIDALRAATLADAGDADGATSAVVDLAAVLSDRPFDVHDAATAAIVVQTCHRLGVELEPAVLEALDLAMRPLTGQMAVFGSVAMHLGPVDNYLGILAGVRGDAFSAAELHRAAVSRAETANQRLWIGWSQCHLAAALAALDPTDVEIARLVDAAQRHARWTGSRRLAAAAQLVGSGTGHR